MTATRATKTRTVPNTATATKIDPATGNSLPEGLVDPRTGVITALVPASTPHHFPTGFSLTHAHLADTTAFCDWPVDSTGAGYAFNDPHRERAAAIGEAIERYCGSLVPTGLRRATRTELLAGGHDVLDPRTVCLYSDRQYASPGFPATRLHDDLVIDWTTAIDLASNAAVLVPASLVWVSHAVTVGPLVNPVIQAGLAAHRSFDLALRSAAAEIIERDAMTLAWYGGQGVTELEVPDWLTRFAAGPAGELQTRFACFDNDLDVPVIAALVHDRSTGYLTLGTGVTGSPTDAALKALGEALQLQLFVADLDDPDGAYAAIAAGPGSPLATWRADRRYRDSYRGDLSDVVDYGCHLQLHLDPRMQDTFHREWDDAVVARRHLEDLPTIDDPVRKLLAARQRLLAVDVTTADVAPTGMHAVRLIAPGRYSNSAIGLPFHGGPRLEAALARPRTSLPTTPLPH